jgi:hypothetical protein
MTRQNGKWTLRQRRRNHGSVATSIEAFRSPRSTSEAWHDTNVMQHCGSGCLFTLQAVELRQQSPHIPHPARISITCSQLHQEPCIVEPTNPQRFSTSLVRPQSASRIALSMRPNLPLRIQVTPVIVASSRQKCKWRSAFIKTYAYCLKARTSPPM